MLKNARFSVLLVNTLIEHTVSVIAQSRAHAVIRYKYSQRESA